MLRARRRHPRLSLVGPLRRAALLAGVLSSTSVLAQTQDDRFPFLAQRVAVIPAQSEVSTPSAVATVIPFPAPSPLRAVRATAHAPMPRAAERAVASVPMPRPAPRALALSAAGPQPVAAPEPLAPFRIAYAAQAPGDELPFAWPIRQTAPEPTPVDTAPRPPAPIPDRTAVPQLEPRYHVRRVPISPPDLVILIENKAIKHGVPLALAHAVVRVESNFDPRLTGPGTTIGLMQIKHPTARAMGFAGTAQDLLEPETNLEWGMRYLARAYRLAKGDVCGTVMRYQGGLHATQMSAAAIPYCGKVKTLMAMR
jgi:soluble lytic murein transglycosylase-like protein